MSPIKIGVYTKEVPSGLGGRGWSLLELGAGIGRDFIYLRAL
ncbi:MAG TPA: hypothetical protein V6D13_05360 [Halomicronema sp.]